MLQAVSCYQVFQTNSLCISHTSNLSHTCSTKITFLALITLLLFGERIKRFTIQFSPASYHFFSLSSKYSLQHSTLQHLQSIFFSYYNRQSFTPIEKNWSFVHFNLNIFKKKILVHITHTVQHKT